MLRLWVLPRAHRKFREGHIREEAARRKEGGKAEGGQIKVSLLMDGNENREMLWGLSGKRKRK